MRLYLSLLLGLLRRAALPRRATDGESRAAPAAGRVHAPTEAPTPAARRSTLLVSGGTNVGALARALAAGATRDGHRLAPHRLAALLDMEESQPTPRASTHRSRTARVDHAVGAREPALGRCPHRWGVTRAGFIVSARTVRRYRAQGRRRPPSQSWQTFLKNHAPHIWAVDLFTVQTLTLQTLYVIMFIGHGRRRIMHVNVTRHPTAPWVWRQLLEATPWGVQPRHLIRDRDRCYGTDFIVKASRLGIDTILTPVHAPNANAIAERVIGTLRRECLDYLIVLNERHLLHVLHEYIAHDNAKRPHRTLALDSPDRREPQAKPSATATAVSRPVLGGLHHEYEWAA